MRISSSLIDSDGVALLDLRLEDLYQQDAAAILVQSLAMRPRSSVVIQLSSNALITSRDIINVEQLVAYLRLMNTRAIVAGINPEAAALLANFTDRAHHFFRQLCAEDVIKMELLTMFSELVYNTVKYAPAGSIEIDHDETSCWIISSDSGEGIAVGLTVAFQEGFSSSGSLGLGLPSLVRMAPCVRVVVASVFSLFDFQGAASE